MKKTFTLFSLLLLNAFLMAQTNQFINYQGVARDNSGNLLANKPVSLRLSILHDSVTGPAAYIETHATTTDGFGLFALKIGQGNDSIGTFETIDWGATKFFLKVEINIGTGYQSAGTSQFAATPYSFFAKNGNPDGQNPGDMLYWNGTTWVAVPAGSNGQLLTFSNGVPTWGGIQSPILSTAEISLITLNSATSGGNIASDGGASISARGVCWDTLAMPTITKNKTANGNGPGSYTSNITGLTNNKTYYLRAYATNSLGTAYGNQVSFTMLSGIISLTTTAVSNISRYTASSGGNITSDGGSSITARGVCYSALPNPTIGNNIIHSGSGTGSYISNLSGLTGGTTYYLRSFATNSTGTCYGNEIYFNTTVDNCIGSFTVSHNIGGGVAPVNKTVTYSTVINIPGEPTKCWITSNLGADHQATAVNDPTEPSAGWYWQFDRKQGFKHDGSIRTPTTTWIGSISDSSDWTSVNDPCTLELGSGWRIPTKTEWTNVDVAGSWSNWTGPWDSGLKLHAAGGLFSSNGSLSSRGTFGYYWSSTQNSKTSGWILYLHVSSSNMNNYDKASGYTIRCLRE